VFVVLVDVERHAINNLYLGYMFLDDVDYLVEVSVLVYDSPQLERRYAQT